MLRKPFGRQNLVIKPKTAAGTITLDGEQGIEQLGLAMTHEFDLAPQFTRHRLPSFLKSLISGVLALSATSPSGKVKGQANRVTSEGGVVRQRGFDRISELSLLSSTELKEEFCLPPPLGAVTEREDALDSTITSGAAISMETASLGNVRSSQGKLAAELLETLGLVPTKSTNVVKVWFASISSTTHGCSRG
jgi:hypothetical protein